MCRDADGILWLATSSGLVSLPQMESRNPTAYQRDFTELSTSIEHIWPDSQGRLWMKTLNRDVIMYKPRSNEFLFDTSAYLKSMGVDVVKEFCILADLDGHCWAGKEHRIYTFTPDGKLQRVIQTGTDDGNVHGLFAQSPYLYALTQESLYYIRVSDGQVVRTRALPSGFSNIYFIYSDRYDNAWIRNFNQLVCYDYAADRWSPAIIFPSEISDVQPDVEGHLWVSTINNGIFICDGEGHVVHHLVHVAGDLGSLQSDRIGNLFYEKDSQTMWVTYRKGGLSVCNTRMSELLPRYITDGQGHNDATDILSFAQSADGSRIWAGLDGQGIYTRGVHQADWEQVLSDGSVSFLYYDKQQRLWAGLYQTGLLRLDADGRQTLYFPKCRPQAVAEDEQGCLFVALAGDGVWRLNPSTGVKVKTGLHADFALDLKYDKGCLYAATTAGFFKMDARGTWHKVCDGRFRSLTIDKEGCFWLLGNDGQEGLTLLGPDGQPTEVPDGLRRAPLRSMAIDPEGRIWITSSDELLMLRHSSQQGGKLEQHVYNINSERSHVYYNFHAIHIDGDNHLWLGSSTGYQCLSIPRLTGQKAEEGNSMPLVIGSVSINDNVLQPEHSGCDVVFLHQLDLQSDENNLMIECSPLYDEGFSSNTYYYQLEGLSDVWYPIKNQAIVLSNLAAGDYRLYTKTEAGEKNLLLSIHIAPPLWRTWWAYLLYVLLFALVVYATLRFYNNKRTYQLQLRRLQMEQEQQAQMNETKLRFFTNISHDLRTPLSLIIGPIEELKNVRIEELKSWEKLQSFNASILQPSLDMIHRNALHLLSLVNQILDFRRLEFGREKLVLSYGDLVPLLRDICASFQLKADKEHISMAFLPAAERIETMFDRDKMTKIMMNLLSNAFKFSSAQGSISVTLGVVDGQIAVSVADTGSGIPDADKPHIFDRFYQSEHDGMPLHMGSGIGLHIVREYVRLHGGDITVMDNPNAKGTVFRFTIPLRKRELGGDGQEVRSERLPESSNQVQDYSFTSHSEPLTSKKSLLLVDDNQDLLSYMTQSLGSGYSILTATNGREALEQLKTNDIDMIVSDVMMPEIDGIELCRRVKTDIETSHIPVVLLTAKAMGSDELKGLEAGADDYITKPFSMDILRQRIHNLMERSQRQHQRFANEIDISPSEITVTSLDELFISKAIAIVEEHISEPSFGVEELSHEMAFHRVQLHKKLLHLTGKTPSLFIRLLRLKRGKQLLEQSGMYVSEVAYQVGFNSPRIFSKYFKEEFGITPKDYFTKQGQEKS